MMCPDERLVYRLFTRLKAFMSNRLSIAIVVYVVMLGAFANNAVSTTYVLYEKRFGLTSLTITMVFATYAVATLVALTLFGRLSDDIGRKPLLIAGTCLVISSTVIFLFARGPIDLYLGRAVMGLATGTLTAAGSAALVELQQDHDSQRASLLTTLGFLTGAALGPLIFGGLEQYLAHPLTTPFLVELGVELLGLTGLLFLKEPALHRQKMTPWRLRSPAVPIELRSRFAFAGLVVAIGWMVGGIYAALSGSLDRRILHVSSLGEVGVILFVFAFIGGLSQMMFRAQPPRTTMIFGVVAQVIGVTCIEWALFSASAPLFLLATVITGVGNGLCFIGSLALVQEIAPPGMKAELVAAYNVVAYFAISLPIIGVGFMADSVGLKSATLAFTVVLVALAVVTLAGMRRLLGYQKGSGSLRESTIV